jgi:phosphate:Na+ symporter
VGGIGLFLLGMRIMSDGIRTVADFRIRSVFASITSNRLYSMLFGIVLSLLLNSASAAVIFTIGLINGGVLNAFQALSVLGGVLIGSSLTLYLPGIPYSLVATPLIFVGVLLKFFAHRRRLANLGDLLLGAGLLFLGLTLLEGSFRPSVSHPFYDAFNGAFFRNPFLAMLFGGAVSCFVQSSLSLTSVVASLVSSHHISNTIASTMVLGGVVGIAAIGGLVSIGGRSIARRTAAAFLLISLSVILVLVVAAPHLLEFVAGSGPVEMIHGAVRGGPLYSHLAWVHGAASMLTAAIVISLSGFVSRLAGVMDDHGGKAVFRSPAPAISMPGF